MPKSDAFEAGIVCCTRCQLVQQGLESTLWVALVIALACCTANSECEGALVTLRPG